MTWESIWIGKLRLPLQDANNQKKVDKAVTRGIWCKCHWLGVRFTMIGIGGCACHLNQGDTKIHGNIYTYWAFHDVLLQHKLIREAASSFCLAEDWRCTEKIEKKTLMLHLIWGVKIWLPFLWHWMRSSSSAVLRDQGSSNKVLQVGIVFVMIAPCPQSLAYEVSVSVKHGWTTKYNRSN